MWRYWEEQLTSEAAEEDAKSFVVSLSNIFREIWLYYFLEPIDLRNMFSEAREEIERFAPEEFLDLMFRNLSVHIRTLEIIKDTVKKMYAYARGENVEDVCLAGEVIFYWGSLLWKLHMAFNPEIGIDFSLTKRIEISVQSQEVFAQAVSPRFMYALQMYNIRRHLTSAIHLLRRFQSAFEIEKEKISIDPSSLAFLANVSYQYIIKLIRKRKLSAFKKGDSKYWLIPISEAVDFVLSRPDCPEWVKRLAGGD